MEPAPGAPKLVFVSIIDSKHDFEKGGWIHKVRSPELSASVAFEVHESQLSRGAKYKKGQQVHVSGVRWRREVLQTAVIKAVKAQDHSFTYDLAIEMKDVEPTEIVGSLGTMVQVDD